MMARQETLHQRGFAGILHGHRSVRRGDMLPTCRCGVIAACVLLLSACASTGEPAFYYDEVVVVNKTLDVVSDVVIAATDSGRVFSCGNIAPRGICSNRFAPRASRGNPIRIEWVVGNGKRNQTLVEPVLPESSSAERPLRGVLVIESGGRVTAFLQAQAPGPHL